jgi:hypothetical protein
VSRKKSVKCLTATTDSWQRQQPSECTAQTATRELAVLACLLCMSFSSPVLNLLSYQSKPAVSEPPGWRQLVMMLASIVVLSPVH